MQLHHHPCRRLSLPYGSRLAYNAGMKTILVLIAGTAAILAVTAIPWILFGAWSPFAGTAIALAVTWVVGSISVWLAEHA